MTAEERDTQRQRVERLARTWITALGLGYWNIRHAYYGEENRDRFSRHEGEALMTVQPDWRYLTATIDINLELVSQISDPELEMHYVHELAHVFLDEMREQDPAHEERVATMLARAFIWLRNSCMQAAATG
ncbi:MAG: hypothetical protein ACOYEW_02745 [Anaerolineae bacterium]